MGKVAKNLHEPQRTTRLKSSDQVRVICGRERGKTGRVLRIDRARGRVYIEGINMVKKTVRPKGQNQKGGISDVEAPMDISNVMINCKQCGPTRIGYRVEDGSKQRICKKCGEQL